MHPVLALVHLFMHLLFMLVHPIPACVCINTCHPCISLLLPGMHACTPFCICYMNPCTPSLHPSLLPNVSMHPILIPVHICACMNVPHLCVHVPILAPLRAFLLMHTSTSCPLFPPLWLLAALMCQGKDKALPWACKVASHLFQLQNVVIA